MTRRSLLHAAAWSTPVVAIAVAAPALALTGGAIDASGVVVTFTDTENGTPEFRLSGSLALSSAPAASTEVTATFTWLGAGGDAGFDGLYLYSGSLLPGWTLTTGRADDTLQPLFAFKTTFVQGQQQTAFASSLPGYASNAIFIGNYSATNTPSQGVLTVRFSAPGYPDEARDYGFNQFG